MIGEICLLATYFSSFCLTEIGEMMGRDFQYNYEETGELEVACFEVRNILC